MALSFHYLYLVVMYPTLVFPLISYRRLGLAHLFDKRWPLAVKFFPFLAFELDAHHALSFIMIITLTQPAKKRGNILCFY